MHHGTGMSTRHTPLPAPAWATRNPPPPHRAARLHQKCNSQALPGRNLVVPPPLLSCRTAVQRRKNPGSRSLERIRDAEMSAARRHAISRDKVAVPGKCFVIALRLEKCAILRRKTGPILGTQIIQRFPLKEGTEESGKRGKWENNFVRRKTPRKSYN